MESQITQRYQKPSSAYSELEHTENIQCEMQQGTKHANVAGKKQFIIFTGAKILQLLPSDNGIGSTSNPRPQIGALLPNRTSDSRTCKSCQKTYQ